MEVLDQERQVELRALEAARARLLHAEARLASLRSMRRPASAVLAPAELAPPVPAPDATDAAVADGDMARATDSQPALAPVTEMVELAMPAAEEAIVECNVLA